MFLCRNSVQKARDTCPGTRITAAVWQRRAGKEEVQPALLSLAWQTAVCLLCVTSSKAHLSSHVSSQKDRAACRVGVWDKLHGTATENLSPRAMWPKKNSFIKKTLSLTKGL